MSEQQDRELAESQIRRQAVDDAWDAREAARRLLDSLPTGDESRPGALKALLAAGDRLAAAMKQKGIHTRATAAAYAASHPDIIDT